MKNSWRYFVVLNETKYGLNNIVKNKDYSGNGLPLCQDFTVAINFSSPDELIKWVKVNTDLDMKMEIIISKVIIYQSKFNFYLLEDDR